VWVDQPYFFTVIDLVTEVKYMKETDHRSVAEYIFDSLKRTFRDLKFTFMTYNLYHELSGASKAKDLSSSYPDKGYILVLRGEGGKFLSQETTVWCIEKAEIRRGDHELILTVNYSNLPTLLQWLKWKKKALIYARKTLDERMQGHHDLAAAMQTLEKDAHDKCKAIAKRCAQLEERGE